MTEGRLARRVPTSMRTACSICGDEGSVRLTVSAGALRSDQRGGRAVSYLCIAHVGELMMDLKSIGKGERSAWMREQGHS